MKFNEVANEWCDYYCKMVKPITMEGHKCKLRKFNKEYGQLKIEEISKLDIQQFIGILNLEGYAKETIRKYKLSIQLVFDFAIDKGYIGHNPAYRVRIPTNAPVRHREGLTDDEIKIVNDSVYKHDLGLFALFLLYTGTRRSEALAVCWQDIDFEDGFISINKVLTYVDKKPVITNKLKNGMNERKVPILSALRPHLLSAKPKDKKGYIFLCDGKFYTKSDITSRWRSYQFNTGLKVTQHQFRHTFASLAHCAGVDAKITQQFLGHKSIKMTLDVYTHLHPLEIKSGGEMLDNYTSNLLTSKI